MRHVFCLFAAVLSSLAVWGQANSETIKKNDKIIYIYDPKKDHLIPNIESSLRSLDRKDAKGKLFSKVISLNDLVSNKEIQSQIRHVMEVLERNSDISEDKETLELDKKTAEELYEYDWLLEIKIRSINTDLEFQFFLFKMDSIRGEQGKDVNTSLKVHIPDRTVRSSAVIINPSSDTYKTKLLNGLKEIFYEANVAPKASLSPYINGDTVYVKLNDTLKFEASSEDPDSPIENITYSWKVDSRLLNKKAGRFDSSWRLQKFICDSPGNFDVMLEVTDGIDTSRLTYIIKVMEPKKKEKIFLNKTALKDKIQPQVLAGLSLFKAFSGSCQFSGIDLNSGYDSIVTATLLKNDLGNLRPDAWGMIADAGFFFGKAKRMGLGIGLMYQVVKTIAQVKDFHVEYCDIDIYANSYRRIITASGPIKEKWSFHALSVPLMFQYKGVLNKKLGFLVSGGISYSLLLKGEYRLNSVTFNHTAVYSRDSEKLYFNKDTSVLITDWVINDKKYPPEKFEEQAKRFRKGLGGYTHSNVGTLSAEASAVSLIFNPTFTYEIFRNTLLTAGILIYTLQYRNTKKATGAYKTTDAVDEYHTLFDSGNRVDLSLRSYTLGLKYFLKTGIK